MAVKIVSEVEENLKKLPDRIDGDEYTYGVRIELLLDLITTWQANGVPDGAAITISGTRVKARWVEKRG